MHVGQNEWMTAVIFTKLLWYDDGVISSSLTTTKNNYISFIIFITNVSWASAQS